MLTREKSLTTFVQLSVCVVLIISFGFITGSWGADEAKPDNDVKTEKVNCVKIMMRTAKRMMKSMSACGKEFKANYTTTQAMGDNIGCVLKCMMQRVNLTDQNGRSSEENMMTMMKASVPEHMVPEVREKVFVPCMDAASKLDPNEANCKTYATYSLCMQTGMEDFMNTSQHCLPRKRI